MTEEDAIHPHCLQCVKLLKCTVAPRLGESCNIVSCPLDCGARFHACKQTEHRLLCMNEKVPCINSQYGCPAFLPRRLRSSHLPSCPASIVHCSEEWDRWPIHLHNNTHTKAQDVPPAHLDVALAKRDQRMLKGWCGAARQGRDLSQQKFTISTSSSLWVFRKWQNSREFSYPPGLEESVCKELCKTCKETAKNAPNYCKSNVNPSSSFFIAEIMDSGETSDKENSGDIHNKIIGPKGLLPPKPKPPPPSHERCYLEDVLQLSQLGTLVYHQSASEGSIYVAPEQHQGCNGGHQSVACSILDLKFRNPSSSPPWCLPLGLDLNLEARSQHPPSNFMYTFLCCQEFRRDEYAWHYKNVHSEIHGGLSGWLLERCPLAQYGCKFARKRFDPLPTHSRVIYNEALESFGVEYSKEEDSASELISNSSKSSRQLNFADLPFDVLQHVVRFLDSFSLSNLSLTSSLFRGVCSTVLRDRGLVTLKWERHRTKDGRSSWRTSDTRHWFFSSHFSPVRGWQMGEQNNMSTHLQSCPYFDRVTQKRAFGYGDPKNVHPPPPDKRFQDPEHHDTTKL